MEKTGQNGKHRGSGSSPTSAYEGALVSRRDGLLKRTWDGFKRDPNASITRPAALGADGKVFDVEAAAQRTADSPLARRLKGRHLQMIAIGGSIGEKHPANITLFLNPDADYRKKGTGLFVGSGKALSTGGPASLLIAFSLIGFMLYCTVHALGELAVIFPVAGSFSAYSTRFIDPAWGFAMGWNYAMNWLITMPLEVVAASITVDFWGSGANNAAWITIFLVLIVSINFFGVKGYGEAEFVFSTIKVIAVIGFM
jgi:amino acid transporter